MNAQTLFHLRVWLYFVALLIALMVLVGGATRLTESGLSITEWKPVAGTLPPLNEAQWNTEFEKYQTTTQYKELNRGMALDEFKTIYWWEWAHRFLGRLIGIAYALPFLFFAFTKNLPRPLLLKLGGILLLGGLQGVIGWWMVASGLEDRINVAPYRLAIHLTLALAIFALILNLAFSFNVKNRHPRESGDLEVPPLDSRWSLYSEKSETLSGCENDAKWKWFLLLLIFLQIFIGGLVAGNRAGYIYNTWPLMDGGFAPDGMFIMKPWWRNFFENAALVQFMHRCTAYVLLVVSFILVWQRWSAGALLFMTALILQAGLGIATLLSEMNFALALMHQVGIIGVLYMALSEFTINSFSR